MVYYSPKANLKSESAEYSAAQLVNELINLFCCLLATRSCIFCNSLASCYPVYFIFFVLYGCCNILRFNFSSTSGGSRAWPICSWTLLLLV